MDEMVLVLGAVIINEVNLFGHQWVELKNASSAPVNLEGWVIQNSRGADTLPSITIEPGGYALLSSSRGVQGADFYFPDGTVGSGLAASADMLVLLRPSGELEDAVNWGEADPSWPNYRPELWPKGARIGATGVIARIPDALDRDSPSDWLAVPEATPRSENSYPMGLDTPSWGKIKALFSGKSK